MRYTNPYLLIYYLLSRSTAIADLVITRAVSTIGLTELLTK